VRLYSVFGLEKVDRWNPLEHPQYSPDIASCDFWAFRSDQEVRTACSTIPKLVANDLRHVFEKWEERYKKWIACQGRYFEKETVTAPPQSSTWSNKVSPRTFQTALVCGYQTLVKERT
jgi:hypothetical protein